MGLGTRVWGAARGCGEKPCVRQVQRPRLPAGGGAAATHLQLILPCDYTGQVCPIVLLFPEARNLPLNTKSPESKLLAAG